MGKRFFETKSDNILALCKLIAKKLQFWSRSDVLAEVLRKNRRSGKFKTIAANAGATELLLACKTIGRG